SLTPLAPPPPSVSPIISSSEPCLSGSICVELLPLISCPTLVLHGEKDPMVPSFHAHFLLQHIAGSRLHLMPEGKHNLHLRFSSQFNQLVQDFLLE
ncbi:valacyclovir hydrolase, partial [Synchiropus picturatus]